jgi:hypothetical protein
VHRRVGVDVGRAGDWLVEWHNPLTGETVPQRVTVATRTYEFVAPFRGDAVLYLAAAEAAAARGLEVAASAGRR